MGNIETANEFFLKGDVLYTREMELPSKENTAIDLLNKTHPLYSTFDDLWTFFLDSYEGGPNFVTKSNIFKHTRETDADYKDRVARAVYLNYVQPLVNFFSNFIFSEEISRDGGKYNTEYQKFIQNVNGKGDSMDLFMREICDLNQIFGHIDILVDKRTKDMDLGTLSLYQEEELGLDKPYFVPLYPHEVLDWTFADNGSFTYLKRRICDGDHKIYTSWWKNKINKVVVKVGDKKDTIVRSQVFENTLGEVPVVRSFYRRSKKYKGIGNSFLIDIAFINRNIMNITSLIGEFLARQCFNMLARETDSSVPFREQESGVIGTGNVLEVPRGAQFPQYISPPVECSQFLQSEREKNVLELYRIASQDTALEIFSGQSRSGDAQSQSFYKTIPYIASRASNLERTEEALCKLWMKWENKNDEWDGHIKYKSDYSAQNFTSMLLQLKTLFSDIKVPSVTFVKSEMLRIVQTYNSKIDSDDLEKIKQEIDKNVTDEYIQKAFSSNKIGASNLKGQVNTAQLQQGIVQSTLGDNKKISMLGADNVV